MNENFENEKKPERIAYWLEISQYDLDTAETLLKGERFLYVGFMCHQVIEKTFKACYVKFQAGVPPFSYNLRYLAGECGIYEQLSIDQKALLNMLEPLNIESRYPDYKKQLVNSLTFEKCNTLLSQTKELSQWLRNQL